MKTRKLANEKDMIWKNDLDLKTMNLANKEVQKRKNEQLTSIRKSKIEVKQSKKTNNMRVGTWNINTLTGKEMEIIEEMEEQDIQILGLSETKKVDQGTIKLTDKYTLYYSGVQKGMRAKEGVGIILNKEINERVVKYETINSRIIKISILLYETINILQIYAPVEGEDEDITNKFYEELQSTIDETRESNGKMIVMGDWNARIGKDKEKGLGVMGGYGEEILNRNGKRMIEFCIENELLIGNSYWDQRLEERYTFVAIERNARSIIDFITFSRNIQHEINNIMTIPETEIGSNHRLVVANLQSEEIEKEKEKEYTRINIYKLKNEEIRKIFQTETDNVFREIEKTNDKWNIEERWKLLKETLIQTAESLCGKRKINSGKKRTDWWTQEIKDIVKKKKQAWKKFNNTKEENDRRKYIDIRNEVKAKVREAKRRSWEDFGRKLEEDYKNNSRRFWNTLRNLKGTTKKEIKGIKNKDGQIQINKRDVLKTWESHYADKFKQIQDNSNVENLGLWEEIENNQIGEITLEEVEDALRNIKVGKAGGEDNIAPEMMKWIGREGIKWMHIICNEAWKMEKIPKDWENNLILPIYKKGDSTQCENFRAICLSSVGYKTYTRILEKRLRQSTEGKLADEQAAFSTNKQTNDNITIIRNTIERAIENGEQLYLAFIDLRAAFDMVQRKSIWRCLQQLQVNRKLITVIKSIYTNVKGKVQIGGLRSESFQMYTGLKQGDSLSPLLFIIMMDRILKNTRGKTGETTIGYRNLTPTKLNSLMYADDIVLIADSKRKMQATLNVWTKELKQLNMDVNIGKSKLMIINDRSLTQEERTITCNHQKLEVVTVYEYLGSVIANDGKLDLEIAKRKQKATNIYHALNKTILSKKEIDIQTKTKVYNTVALQSLLYASETWVPLKKHLQQINTIEMKYLRRIAGKTRHDRIRNTEIRQMTEQEPITTKLENRQLNWFGHITRMGQERLVRSVIESGRLGKRKRGRPRKTWIDRIKDIGTSRGKTLEELKIQARDRKRWKKWIKESSNMNPTP